MKKVTVGHGLTSSHLREKVTFCNEFLCFTFSLGKKLKFSQES